MRVKLCSADCAAALCTAAIMPAPASSEMMIFRRLNSGCIRESKARQDPHGTVRQSFRINSGILGVTMDESTTTPPDLARATPASALPSFESCRAAVSAGAQSGIDALGALSGPLQQGCPELAGILRSSAVRTSLEIYTRQDAEAVRQQASLVQEA